MTPLVSLRMEVYATAEVPESALPEAVALAESYAKSFKDDVRALQLHAEAFDVEHRVVQTSVTFAEPIAEATPASGYCVQTQHHLCRGAAGWGRNRHACGCTCHPKPVAA